MSHDRIEVSRTIAAEPAAVWAAVSDITRMGEWSPECHTARWVDGATGPATDAWFEGENRNGDFEWTTRAVVVECDPERRFVFEGDADGFRFSRWGYEIEPSDDGCVVTEFNLSFLPESFQAVSAEISGVEDRESHNQAGMAATLERLAATLEA
ncbi:SRPBCC family protein [Ilumatobacter nonamiensis]|uniref:SRPBCC family protein n=1 Tax=Ilumatobacter nonamiensis TaxID=467093 RepID=UPI00034A7D09|nr:SRPBCC family protein [Ilumatobacter nonamiensis]